MPKRSAVVAPSFGQARYRSVSAEILLPAGWITGTFVVPENQSFIDFLAHSGAFLKLTDALVPGHQDVVPFFAIQRGAVQLIVPSSDDDRVVTPGSMGITAPWSISCLFERGAVHGSLDFLMNQRLSDFLKQQTGFLVIREARWTPIGDGDQAGRAWPLVLVNVPQLNGISEAVDQRGRGHPAKLAPTEFEAT
jgi:hypothetical protein